MADIFLPTLHTFAMNNVFTGSCGLLRFKIVPNVVKSETNPKEVDMEQSSITFKNNLENKILFLYINIIYNLQVRFNVRKSQL